MANEKTNWGRRNAPGEREGNQTITHLQGEKVIEALERSKEKGLDQRGERVSRSVYGEGRGRSGGEK